MTTYAFSALPYHMVRQVATYVCQPKSELDMDDSGKKPVDPLVALLHICHNWRQVTLPMMFGSGYIGTSAKNIYGPIYAWYNHSILQCINQSYNAYMQHLSVFVNIDEIIFGKMLTDLTACNIGSFVFPNLKHFTLYIRYIRYAQFNCPNANSNIRKLVQHICLMLPVLESVTLNYTGLLKTISICVDTHQNAKNMVDELSETLSVIYPIHKTLIDSTTKYSLLINGLTSLLITWVGNYSPLSNLIHANSQSLQKLRIMYCEFDGLKELVHCDNSKQAYMRYPRLTELTLGGKGFTLENIVPPTGNAVVFPRLCKVKIMFEYPFSDDVLFRGNRWTLESVELVLSTQTMMQLSSDGVFNKGNMIAMQDVVICGREESTINAMLNNCSKNFFRGLLSSSCYLVIKSQPYLEILIDSINCKTQYHTVRYLHLGCSNVSFENIEVLLQALPQLSYLKSAISSLGNNYIGMSLPKLLKSMQAKFNPLSKSFCTWSIHSLDIALVDLVTTCILLLMDQCPKFQTVVFNKVTYTTSIKIYEQLMRTSYRIVSLNSRRNEKLEFNISFAPEIAAVKIIRNSL